MGKRGSSAAFVFSGCAKGLAWGQADRNRGRYAEKTAEMRTPDPLGFLRAALLLYLKRIIIRKELVMKLLRVDTLEEARDKLRGVFAGRAPETEMVRAADALGRTLAGDVVSGEAVPSFYRSSVDGYAVRSADTAGASESIPAFLEMIGEIPVGTAAGKAIGSGQCMYVPTGGMVPEGADAVVMVEYCEPFDADHVAVYEAVPFGGSVVVPGEDVKEGQLLLARGSVISPAGIGALAAAGIGEVPVYQPWRVSILSTGDELVMPGRRPGPGQVRDINSAALAASAAKAGFQVIRTRLLADDEALLEAAVREAMADSDLVLVSGGSSQGKKDVTCEVLDRVSGGGVFTHGLAIKPGKPTILGFDSESGALLMGLPGHPVAALTVFGLLAFWLWRELTGQREEWPAMARMRTNLASAPGKLTCVPVRLYRGADGYEAEPVLGKSGLITTMSQADGYVKVEMNREGLKRGEWVEIHRFL
jgi:molybdopterin molybdotransferase